MEYILETKDLSKVYGNGTAANRHVDFSVRPGEILGLVGENGAGKSTLMKILYGEEAPTSGNLLLDGKPVSFNSSRDAIAAGIGMVHQHFMLVPSLSLAENLVLGRNRDVAAPDSSTWTKPCASRKACRRNTTSR